LFNTRVVPSGKVSPEAMVHGVALEGDWMRLRRVSRGFWEERQLQNCVGTEKLAPKSDQDDGPYVDHHTTWISSRARTSRRPEMRLHRR
jgi:hypothetical protein